VNFNCLKIFSAGKEHGETAGNYCNYGGFGGIMTGEKQLYRTINKYNSLSLF